MGVDDVREIRREYLTLLAKESRRVEERTSLAAKSPRKVGVVTAAKGIGLRKIMAVMIASGMFGATRPLGHHRARQDEAGRLQGLVDLWTRHAGLHLVRRERIQGLKRRTYVRDLRVFGLSRSTRHFGQQTRFHVLSFSMDVVGVADGERGGRFLHWRWLESVRVEVEIGGVGNNSLCMRELLSGLVELDLHLRERYGRQAEWDETRWKSRFDSSPDSGTDSEVGLPLMRTNKKLQFTETATGIACRVINAALCQGSEIVEMSSIHLREISLRQNGGGKEDDVEHGNDAGCKVHAACFDFVGEIREIAMGRPGTLDEVLAASYGNMTENSYPGPSLYGTYFTNSPRAMPPPLNQRTRLVLHYSGYKVHSE
ncbi:hypothetical protein B0H16DRAFT_1450205 [Mycena metata]|uniref:Uncharacterized protein n=1 Tax=Mycena metata TaxID=1033252 RepID=A0AAD7K4I1_9AGAR|nr:hypothetical protein B0H16DRAFT_1450205 [Mycena metata]